MIRKLLLLSYSVLLLANAPDALDLLDDLKDASKIATRSNLNINKTPAVVTVLYSDELKKLGVVNLYEALGYVPGIELSMGDGGAKQIIMRGNKGSLRDKLKLMIDGVSANNKLSGSNYMYLDLPIDIIEKIEIIRGPASALYGSFAHIGVINVITKSSLYDHTNIFTRVSSEGYKNFGFIGNIVDQNYKLSLNGYVIKNDNSRTYQNYSLLPSTRIFQSYEDFINSSAGVHLQLYDNIQFSSRILKNDTQNFYGYGSWPIVGNPKNVQQFSFINELRYTPKLSSNLSLDIRGGYHNYTFKGNSNFIPSSIMGSPYDLMVQGYYKEEVYYGDIALKYNDQKQTFLVGTYLSKAREVETNYYKNNTLTPIINIPDPAIPSGIKQEQYAFYISDIYSFSEKLSVNLALRYDAYSLTDNGYAPKLAFMYNPNEHQSYKLLYQRSFRVPSWLELYGLNEPFVGDTNLKSETIDTLEFVYRYEAALHTYVNLNLYYNRLHDVITKEGTSKYINGQDIDSYGFELDAKHQFNAKTMLQANYSYVHMQYDNNVNVPLIANHIGHITLSHEFSPSFSSGTTLSVISQRKREQTDTRASLHGYTTLDQAFTYTYKKIAIQGTIKNIFDNKVIYPAPLGNETTIGTYKDDLVRDGRSFWLSLSWNFE
jgi:outer membrane receptor protein involved in Fe transport